MKKQRERDSDLRGVAKTATGIAGLDEITSGGLPTGRPTLVCGGPGCGKTLLSLEFLVRGAQNGEPGVFVSFEETPKELTENIASLGVDLDKLIRQKKLFIDYVIVERSEIHESGEFDLDGLFIRLADAVGRVGAKRIVLDTLESLFSGLPNEAILRAELRRLFRWLKDQGLTAIITAERGDSTLTRYGLEEYVSDCVIVLDHRVTEQLATRRMRIVKYRGSVHGTNEYPFLIDESGMEVLPITSMGLDYESSTERIGSGIETLDQMLGGGIYRGSTVLLSGTAGTGKTSLACQIAAASCERRENAVYFAFEESTSQIVRNVSSIGIDLQPSIESGLLKFFPARPTMQGLESHLALMYKRIRENEPKLVIIDPITNFTSVGHLLDIKSMLVRLVDFLKSEQITGVFTSLTQAGAPQEATDLAFSSIVDSWIVLRDIEFNGERNRGLYVLKSRGAAHSNQIRELEITSNGIRLTQPYLGPEGVLTGSARVVQESREAAAAELRKQETERYRRAIEQRRAAYEAQIQALRTEFENETAELQKLIEQAGSTEEKLARVRDALTVSRRADETSRGDATSRNRKRMRGTV